MKLFLLVPMLLLSVTRLIALLGMPGEAQAHGLRRRQFMTAEAAYLVGFIGATCALVQGLLLRHVGESALSLIMTSSGMLAVTSLITVAAVVAGPLVWGHMIREFHPSHHVVRAILLATVEVLYWIYVSLNR